MAKEGEKPLTPGAAERGKFITLEGGEGGGKTTQLTGLAEYLRTFGLKVLTTREPGGTRISDQVRRVILDVGNTELVPEAETLLFQAARAQLVRELLNPVLADGVWIVGDRFADSTLAYQGYGHGKDLKTLMLLVEYATGGLKPDLTLLLDVDLDKGLKRKKLQNEWNRLDGAALEFHARVKAGYTEMAAREPQRWRVIDANQSPETVQAQIQETVTSFFGLRAVGTLGLPQINRWD
jgi:dTMP kinase